MFVRKFVIPLLAVAGVAFAVYTARSANQPIAPAPPVADPAKSPFATPVAGAGIVESSSQNIAIGTNLPGIVTAVAVKAGDKVKAGDPLFSIDDRALRAEFLVRKAAVLSAQSTLRSAEQSLSRLLALPRVEDVPPAEARVAEMEAMMTDMKTQLRRLESVDDPRAIVKDDLDRRRAAVSTAEAKLAESRAQLALLKAGAWAPDVEIARAGVDAARAQVEAARAQEQAVEIDLERLTVKAPVDGDVLQLNLRVGEFAQAGPLSTPLVLLGNTDTLHVRVDVDENDAWKVRPNAKATANLRGNASMKTDLTFVRIEPFVVPKRSLTGDSAERVDTRVLQVLYAFRRGDFPVYVGQQMDVYIDASK
jgi:multidrug resistance efflux pump